MVGCASELSIFVQEGEKWKLPEKLEGGREIRTQGTLLLKEKSFLPFSPKEAMKRELGKILMGLDWGTGLGNLTLDVSLHHNFFKPPECLLEQLNSIEFCVNIFL